MNNCIVRSRVISTEIWFSSSSIFGICGLILIQLSFSFRESSAIFTDLSLFTVITTGDTKQSSSTSFILSKCPDLISFSNFFLRLLVGVMVPVGLFVLPENVRVSIVFLFRYLLLFRCFQTSPEICL